MACAAVSHTTSLYTKSAVPKRIHVRTASYYKPRTQQCATRLDRLLSARNSPTRIKHAAVAPETESTTNTSENLVGEDSAAFDLSKQSVQSWVLFFGVFVVVMLALYELWIQPGVGLGNSYLSALEALAGNDPQVTMLVLLGVFGVIHSGLAGLRPKGEAIIGARAWRVLFAGISLPLATVTIVYFINHRYDGVQLWNLREVPGLHEFVWITNFVSFWFLYPSTFNLLEVAAVDKPQVHLWESGIIRITRHPQMVGQFMWCLAHSLWIGNSFILVATGGLMAHHLFACWHGDRRLADKYGEAFEVVKGRTSIMPFQAIWEGRQKLPEDYYKEFVRVPYAVITAVTIGAYLVHPYMQLASWKLQW